jgi:hypothetical protein
MGAPRQIRAPAQLTLFPTAPPIVTTSPADAAHTATSPRWRVGHAAALYLGDHSITQWLRDSDEAWILDLAGWIERRVLQALREDPAGAAFPTDLFVPATRGTCPRSPVALWTLVLVGTLRGVTSLRELERFAALDLRGIWIMGGWCPDHSTIGRFIARLHGTVSVQLFERLTTEALCAIGKRVCDVSLDGTIVCAVASRYGRLHAEAVAERLDRAPRQVAAAPAEENAAVALAQAAACAQALASQPQTRRETARDLASIAIGPSEPEAVVHTTKEGAFHPAYVASVIATPERFIVGVEVDARDELASVVPLLDQARAISAQVHAALSADVPADAAPADVPADAAPADVPAAGPAHTIAVARADGNYLVSKVLDLEARLGIELRINIGSFADSVPQPQGFNPNDRRAFAKDRFHLVVLPATAYAPERRCLQCPMGALLHHERNYPATGHVPAATSYRAHGVRCATCPYASRCLQKANQRTVRRYASDAQQEQMRDRMLAPEVRAERGARTTAVEPCFASLKGPQRLRRFHRRGLRGVRLEFRLHALAHNMGRLVALAHGGRRGGRRGGAPAALQGGLRRARPGQRVGRRRPPRAAGRSHRQWRVLPRERPLDVARFSQG